MKYCSKCGKEINDEAVICLGCGCRVDSVQKIRNAVAEPESENNEKSTLSTLAMVFSFLCPVAGLVLGIIGMVKFKNPSSRKKCVAAIIISIVMWILGIVLTVIAYQLLVAPDYYYRYSYF